MQVEMFVADEPDDRRCPKEGNRLVSNAEKEERDSTGEEGGRQGRGHPQLLPGLRQAQPDQRSAEAVLSVQQYQA